MKKIGCHGLWRFHYESRTARERLSLLGVQPALWWKPEELNKAHDQICFMHSGYGKTRMHSNADAIAVCAYRYSRRFKVSIRTVKEWNELCRLIANRSGFNHHTTLKSLLIDRARDKTPIRIQDFCAEARLGFRAYPARSLREILARAERFKDYRRGLIEKEEKRFLLGCVTCGKKVYRSTWVPYCGKRKADDVFSELRAALGNRDFGLCFFHYMQFKKLEKDATKLTEAATELREIERKYRAEKRTRANEATEVNA